MGRREKPSLADRVAADDGCAGSDFSAAAVVVIILSCAVPTAAARTVMAIRAFVFIAVHLLPPLYPGQSVMTMTSELLLDEIGGFDVLLG
jgi:hypothetical protein